MGRKKENKVRWADGSTDPYMDAYHEIAGSPDTYWNQAADKHPSASPAIQEDKRSNPDSVSDEQLQDLTRSEDVKLVNQALQSLTERQQQVMQLVAFDGLSNREAAEDLGIDESTVREAYAAALVNIKKFYLRNRHK